MEIATEVQQQLLVSMANEEDDGSRPNWWIGGFRDNSKPDEEVLFLDGKIVSMVNLGFFERISKWLFALSHLLTDVKTVMITKGR